MKSGYDIHGLLELTKTQLTSIQEGGETMSENKNRSVYRVIAVDWKTGKVVLDEIVVEKNEQMATMKAMTQSKVTIDLDRVDIGCTVVIADFVRPKKETQKVVIEKEEKEEVA
jgi:hypothetical protein